MCVRKLGRETAAARGDADVEKLCDGCMLYSTSFSISIYVFIKSHDIWVSSAEHLLRVI